MSVGLQRTIHVTTEDHILRRIQVAGLALNVAAIALLSSRLFATTPFKIPFRDWHSIQRLQLYALASAILQQMLDFAVVLLRLLEISLPAGVKTMLLSLSTALLWASAVSLLFAVLKRYQRISLQIGKRITALTFVKSLAVLLAIVSASLYILNTSVTRYNTKNADLGRFYTASMYADYVSVLLIGGTIMFSSYHMVIIGKIRSHLKIVIMGFKAKFNLPARMALLTLKFSSLLLAQLLLIVLAALFYFNVILPAFETAYIDITIVSFALLLSLFLLDLLQDQAVVRSMSLTGSKHEKEELDGASEILSQINASEEEPNSPPLLRSNSFSGFGRKASQ